MFMLAIAYLTFPLPDPPEQGAEPKPAEQAAPKPCQRPEVRQFDFWVGEWDLTWPDGGRGTNVIEHAFDGCVVKESFSAETDPLRGTSVSTFNAATGKWQQTWVDNQGSYLDFVGELRDGTMVLTREATIKGAKVLQRMVWHNIAKDSFDWNWERSDDGGKTWKVLWPIHYERKKPASAAASPGKCD
jgi:hypothetical protein